MRRSDLRDYNDAYIVVKRIITVSATAGVNESRDRKIDLYHLKIMHHLSAVFQK